MLRVFQIIFAPSYTWLRISEAQRGVVFVLLVSFLPLLAVCLAVEGYALMHWGEQRGEFGTVITITLQTVIKYGITHAALFLVSVFLGALLLRNVAESFHLRTQFSHAFATMAYGISPMVLLRLADAIPTAPTWICWGIGALLSLATLYHGIALVLKPDQTKGFGIYMVAAFLILISTGLSHLLAITVLHGQLWRTPLPL